MSRVNFEFNEVVFEVTLISLLGFDGTSNVLAGKLCGIPVKGTQAHAFITSFTPDELPSVGKLQPTDKSKEPRDFYPVVLDWLKKVCPVLRVLESEVHVGELAAFSAYAVAFPETFLALVDTYDVLRYRKKGRCRSMSVSEQQGTYPSLNPTLMVTCYQ